MPTGMSDAQDHQIAPSARAQPHDDRARRLDVAVMGRDRFTLVVGSIEEGPVAVAGIDLVGADDTIKAAAIVMLLVIMIPRHLSRRWPTRQVGCAIDSRPGGTAVELPTYSCHR